MRSPLLVLFLVGFVSLAHSQSDELLVQGQTGKLYLEHTVVAKENWYSVGRLYNANPKELPSFNHVTLTQPLIIGQTLQIPLTAANFSQNGQKLPSETLVPVYHVIQEKEWLYRISINYNKVPVPSLEKWNHINKDQAKAGMHLIIGYLKVKTALSALAKPGAVPATAAAAPPAPEKATQPAAEKIANGSTSENPTVTEPKKETTPVNPTTTPATTLNTSKPVNATTKADRPLASPPVSNMATSTTTTAEPALHFNGGYFKNDFTESGKSLSGQAGTFKSTSGWQDGKYYALMNNVAVGTIVKVSMPGTEKTVYVKVLGQLPDMKESVGLLVRISNAAAGELGTGEGRFNVALAY